MKTGRFTYPTDGAIQLAQIAQESGAKVIMFPEWSRSDVPEEYLRIRAIHDSIAKETGAIVAPIGEAWKLALEKGLGGLYAADGNHAERNGSYLNAAVFFCLIEEESPKPSSSENSEEQHLEALAWQVTQAERKQISETSSD